MSPISKLSTGQRAGQPEEAESTGKLPGLEQGGEGGQRSGGEGTLSSTPAALKLHISGKGVLT